MILKLPLCLAAMFFASVASAQDPKPAPAPHPAPADQGKSAEKKPTFAVVVIGDQMKVMNENAIEQLKKDKHAEHEKAMAAHNKAKKEAEDAGKPFTEKPPAHATIEVKKGGFASEALAKEHLDSLSKGKKDGDKHEKDKDKKDGDKHDGKKDDKKHDGKKHDKK